MKVLVENWVIIVVFIAIIVVDIAVMYSFFKLPNEKQFEKVKEWLLYAVAQAEKELGGGTGQLKLRYVYGLFIDKFPYLADTISFEVFSGLVDEALDKFKGMLQTNISVQNYINKEEVK